jgi:hypothetical protein
MSCGLEYRERLDLFQQSLLAVLSTVSCQAIYWKSAQRIINPKSFLESAKGDAFSLFMSGAVNVRMYSVEGVDDGNVMDTLGLAPLGIPDLQCHFRGLDKDLVAKMLYNTAWYLFENGDIISDGSTVVGLDGRSRWRCQHGTALVAPERQVIDVAPGSDFSSIRGSTVVPH